MYASLVGHTEIVKLLLGQEGIDVNAINVYLFSSNFISIIFYFKIIHGIYSNYLIQQFIMQLNWFK